MTGWPDFASPAFKDFVWPTPPEGHEELISMICQMSAPVHVGFEATGGQEWVLWTALMEAGIGLAPVSPDTQAVAV